MLIKMLPCNMIIIVKILWNASVLNWSTIQVNGLIVLDRKLNGNKGRNFGIRSVFQSQHPLLVPLLLADLLRSECTRTQSLHPPPSTLLPAHTPNDLRDISTGVSHRRHSLRTPRLTPDYTMAAWLAFHPILPLTLAKTWQASLNLYFLPHPHLTPPPSWRSP